LSSSCTNMLLNQVLWFLVFNFIFLSILYLSKLTSYLWWLIGTAWSWKHHLLFARKKDSRVVWAPKSWMVIFFLDS
jgi:hypothetical protein